MWKLLGIILLSIAGVGVSRTLVKSEVEVATPIFTSIVKSEAPTKSPEEAYFASFADIAVGTQGVVTTAGNDILYFNGGTFRRFVIINAMGNGQIESNPATFDDNALEKWFRDAGVNWDGKYKFLNGQTGLQDSVYLTVVSIPFLGTEYTPDYTPMIANAWQHLLSEGFDTSQAHRIAYTGLSGGVNRMLNFMVGASMSTSDPAWAFRRINGYFGALSGCSYGNLPAVTDSTGHLIGSFVWTGENDVSNPCVSVNSMNALHTALSAQSKRKTIFPGGSHGSDTWDPAWSMTASTSDSAFLPFFMGNWTGLDSLLPIVPIEKRMIADFGAFEGHVADTANKFFDSESDPYRGIIASIDTTTSWAISAFSTYFGPNNSRIIHIKLDSVYDITKLFARTVQNGFGLKDTMYIYGDTTFQTHAGMNSFLFVSSWTKALADAGGAYTPNIKITSVPAGTGWKQEWSGTMRAQYITMCMTYSPTQGQTNFADFKFYGDVVRDGEAEFKTLTVAQARALSTQRKATIREMYGANFSNFSDTAYQTLITNHRDGADIEFYMTDDYDSISLNASALAYLDYLNDRNPFIRIYPFFNGKTGHLKPIDNPGSQDGMHPDHYRQHFAKAMGWFTAVYGRNTTNQPHIRANIPIGGFGKNYWKAIDPINESNGAHFPDFYMTPIRNAAFHIAVFDSIKHYDPTMETILGAAAGADTRYQQATLRLMQMWYGNDLINYVNTVGLHAYHVNNRALYWWSLPDRIIGSRSVDPSDLGYFQDMDRYCDEMWQEVGWAIDIDVNEYGADKDTNVAASVDDQYIYSLYNAPQYDSWDANYNQHNYLVQSHLRLCESRVRRGAIYWWMDVFLSITSYQNSGLLKQFGDQWENPDSTRFYSSMFGVNGLVDRFGEYYNIALIDTAWGGAHVAKYRHKDFADSVLYIVRKNAYVTGDSVEYTIPASQVIGTMRRWKPRMVSSIMNDFNWLGTQATETPSSGTYTLKGGTFTSYYVFRESLVAPEKSKRLAPTIKKIRT